MNKNIFYATNNPGKVYEVASLLKSHSIGVITPRQKGINIDVDESGSTLEENATLKARAFKKLVSDMIIIADDTGVEIDALGGEPGIHVRRWKDKKTSLTDEEIIAHCLNLLKDIPQGKRWAQFRTVVALVVPGKQDVELYDGILRGEILVKPRRFRMQGFPFEPIFFIPEWKMTLAQVHRLPLYKRHAYLTHRQRAVTKAIPMIKDILDDMENHLYNGVIKKYGQS